MIEVYVAVAISLLVVDAFACFMLGWRYRWLRSVVASGLWPVCVPVIVFGAAYHTRNYPDMDVTRLMCRIRRWIREDQWPR